MMSSPLRGSISRRNFLVAGGALAVAGLSFGHTGFAATVERKRVLRLAHLADIHVMPELRAAEGLAACLRHVNSVEDRPDLILTGGDHVRDSFKSPRERTATQWDLWSSRLKNENSIPIRACLGNHDIWGWDNSKSGTKGDEPGYGKKWACDVLGLNKPYYSFTQAGWHFIALDGLQPNPYPGEFSAFLDEEQFDWLSRELASVPKTTPILLWTHIPIVSAVVNHLALRKSIHDISTLEAGHVHADSVRLVALFANHLNVKVCLAGHLHRIEHVELKGVRHYINGAVCGKWWRGANDGYPEGYAVVDLYDDGSHENRFVTYGWKSEFVEKSK
ncbi:MAG: metallophosphoesterase [Planctomycetota bacterium]